jgi:hypothetical protein
VTHPTTETDLVERLRFLRRTSKFKYAKDQFYMIGEVMHEAADEIERSRSEMKRINDLAIHLNSGGRDPDEKCYSKRDVEALIALSRAVEKKHG